MPSKNYQLTPEQLALSEERKRKRAEQKKNEQQTNPLFDVKRARILDRPWVAVAPTAPGIQRHKVKVKTWNVCVILLFAGFLLIVL